jgi:hypothetical protein
MRKNYSVILFLFIIFFLLTFFTCTPKKKQEEKNPGEVMELVREMEEKNEIEDEPFSTTSGIENENGDNDETFTLEEVEPSEIKTSYTVGSQKYLTFLPQLSGSSILPEDFIIGSLYNEEEASRDSRLIKDVIADFFDSLKEEEIMTSLLYEGEKSGLYRLLTFHLKNGRIPQKYRIGTITEEDNNTGYAVVRIYGKIGRTVGEIYVTNTQGKWYISDIQANFYELEVSGEKNGGKFLPSTYNGIIQGM